MLEASKQQGAAVAEALQALAKAAAPYAPLFIAVEDKFRVDSSDAATALGLDMEGYDMVLSVLSDLGAAMFGQLQGQGLAPLSEPLEAWRSAIGAYLGQHFNAMASTGPAFLGTEDS